MIDARLWMAIAMVACSAPPTAPRAPTTTRPVAVAAATAEEEQPPAPAPASRVRFEPQLGNAQSRAIAWSMDGKYLLVGGETSVTAWEVESGIRLAEVYAPPEVGEYGDVAFYRDRYAIAASFGGAKNEVDVFDLNERKLERRIVTAGRLNEFTFAHDAGLVIAVEEGSLGSPSTIQIVEVETGKIRKLADAKLIGLQTLDLAVSRDGRRLVIASKKRVDVWDPIEGKLLRTIAIPEDALDAAITADGKRAFIGQMYDRMLVLDLARGVVARTITTGGLQAAAPDGSVIVAPPERDERIPLVDPKTGTRLRMLTGSPRTPHDLGSTFEFTVSFDGRRIAAIRKLEPGIELWETSTGAHRRLGGSASAVSGVAVSADGGRAAITTGGRIVAWSLQRLLATGSTQALEPQMRRASFGTDGEIGALGLSVFYAWNGAGEPRVREPVANARRGYSKRNVPYLAYAAVSADRKLALRIDHDGKYGPAEAVLVDPATAAPIRTLAEKLHAYARGAAFTHDGKRVVVVDGKGAIRVFDTATGAVVASRGGGGRLDLLDVSPDGAYALIASDSSTAGLFEHADVKLVGTFAIDDIPYNGNSEYITAGAFTPDGSKIAIGTYDRRIAIFDRATARLEKTLVGHGGPVTALAFTPGAARLLSGSSDGTSRLWHVATGNSVVLVASDGEWLAYTDDGYFDASPGGGRLGAAVDGLDGYRIDQLAARNNRPDVLLERVGLGSKDFRGYLQRKYKQRLQRLGLDEARVATTLDDAPVAVIAGATVNGKQATVVVSANAGSADLIGYNLYVNGVAMHGSSGLAISGRTLQRTETVELVAGANRVEVSVLDAAGMASLRPERIVTYAGPADGELHFIGFGVSRYKNAVYNLSYPHKDVHDLADVFRKATQYKAVHIHTFTDEQATVANLKAARALLERARVDDTVVVFVAGHGVHTSDAAADYYFATHETDAARLRDTAASFDLIEALFEGIAPRQKLLLLDTCESGERDDDLAGAATGAGLAPRSVRQLVRVAAPVKAPVARPYLLDRDRFLFTDLSRRTGTVVFSSSRGSELSWEMPKIANGVFTEHLLRALTGPGDRFVPIATLRDEVSRAVATTTNDLQHPVIDRDNPDARLVLPRVPSAAAIADRIDLGSP